MPIFTLLGAANSRHPPDRRTRATSRPAGSLVLAACLAACLAVCGGCGGGGDTSPQTPPSPAPVPSGHKYLVIQLKGQGSVGNAQGSLYCTASCHVEFSSSTVITLQAAPSAGETFLGWSGACSGTSPTCTVRVDQDRQVDASFTSVTQAQWQAQQTVSSPGADAPSVAVDGAGRALAAWLQATSTSTARQLMVSTSASGRWGTPVRLDVDGGDVSAARLAVDASSGRGVVVWRQLGTSHDLWAATYDPATGWGSPTRLEPLAGAVGAARVGMDAQGRAFAVWEQLAPNGRISIYAARLVPGAGWSAPALLKVNDTLGATEAEPELAVAANGDALVVWRRSDGVSARLWASRFVAASGWSLAVEVVPDGGTSSSIGGHALVADAGGQGLLVWGQRDLNQGTWLSSVKFKRFARGAWQSTAADVAPPVASQGYLSHPVAAMNATGTAVVAWQREDDAILAASAAPNAAFGTAVAVRSARTPPLNAPPVLALDATGRVLLAWTDSDLWLTQGDAARSWSPASLQETLPDAAGFPALGVTVQGAAVLAWRHFIDGEGTRILARQFKTP